MSAAGIFSILMACAIVAALLVSAAWGVMHEDRDAPCEISGQPRRSCNCAAHSWYLH